MRAEEQRVAPVHHESVHEHAHALVHTNGFVYRKRQQQRRKGQRQPSAPARLPCPRHADSLERDLRREQQLRRGVPRGERMLGVEIEVAGQIARRLQPPARDQIRDCEQGVYYRQCARRERFIEGAFLVEKNSTPRTRNGTKLGFVPFCEARVGRASQALARRRRATAARPSKPLAVRARLVGSGTSPGRELPKVTSSNTIWSATPEKVTDWAVPLKLTPAA